MDYVLNSHNKEEFPPAHTAEHLLNQVMIRMFGTERSNNAHIERKKSKMTFILDHKPDRKEEKAIEDEMNRLIAEDLPVTFEMVDLRLVALKCWVQTGMNRNVHSEYALKSFRLKTFIRPYSKRPHLSSFRQVRALLLVRIYFTLLLMFPT